MKDWGLTLSDEHPMWFDGCNNDSQSTESIEFSSPGILEYLGYPEDVSDSSDDPTSDRGGSHSSENEHGGEHINDQHNGDDGDSDDGNSEGDDSGEDEDEDDDEDDDEDEDEDDEEEDDDEDDEDEDEDEDDEDEDEDEDEDAPLPARSDEVEAPTQAELLAAFVPGPAAAATNETGDVDVDDAASEGSSVLWDAVDHFTASELVAAADAAEAALAQTAAATDNDGVHADDAISQASSDLWDRVEDFTPSELIQVLDMVEAAQNQATAAALAPGSPSLHAQTSSTTTDDLAVPGPHPVPVLDLGSRAAPAHSSDVPILGNTEASLRPTPATPRSLHNLGPAVSTQPHPNPTEDPMTPWTQRIPPTPRSLRRPAEALSEPSGSSEPVQSSSASVYASPVSPTVSRRKRRRLH